MTSAPDVPDVPRLLEALDRHGAQYLIVGGVGARAHGATRLTKDLDCVVRHDRENLERVAAAMRELGAQMGAQASGVDGDDVRGLVLLERAQKRLLVLLNVLQAGGPSCGERATLTKRSPAASS